MTPTSAPRPRARLAGFLSIIPAAILFGVTMLAARSYGLGAPTGSGDVVPGPSDVPVGPSPVPPIAGPYTGPNLQGVFVSCAPECDLLAVAPGVGLRLTFTDRATEESAPALSPDGSRVAFRCRTPAVEPGGTASPLPAGPGSICVTSARTTLQGGTPPPVTTLLSTVGFDYGSPAWSPDGTTIAFDFAADTGASGIGEVPAAGGVPTTVTEAGMDGAHPAWSPDGTTLAFGCGTTPGPEDIPQARFCVMPRAGGMVTALGAVGGDCGAPTFTPDVTQLAVICVGAGTTGGDLFFLALAEPMSRSITASQLMAPEGQRRVVFSPDGVLAFVRRDDALWALKPLTNEWSLPPLPPLNGDFDIRVTE